MATNTQVLKIVKEVRDIFESRFKDKILPESFFDLDSSMRSELVYVDRRFPELLERHRGESLYGEVFNPETMGISFNLRASYCLYPPSRLTVVKSDNLFLIGYPNDTSKWEDGFKYEDISAAVGIVPHARLRGYPVTDYKGDVGRIFGFEEENYIGAVSKDLELFLRGVKPKFGIGKDSKWLHSYNSAAVKLLGTPILSKYIVVAFVREKDGRIYYFPPSYGKKASYVGVGSPELLKEFLRNDLSEWSKSNIILSGVMGNDYSPMCFLRGQLPTGDFVHRRG